MKPYFEKDQIEAGCDEAGRGCLAGPVVAAATILPNDFYDPTLNDSKKLTPRKRQRLVPIIKDEAIAWSVAFVHPRQIEELNILNASFAAMHQAISELKQQPSSLLIDGNKFLTYDGIPHHCIIQGDSKYASIAAASILAKEARDDYMRKLHEKHPEYAWNNNKGYPTKSHRKAIKKLGPTIHHRRTFQLLPQLELDI